MTIYEEAVQLTRRLTLAEKALLLEQLSAALRQDIETEAYRHMPPHESIPAGSLAEMAYNAQAAGLASAQPVNTAERSREILSSE